ncbi:MAG: hypothetical protein ACI4I8_06825 [Oscillospiraceae bacterium]
MNREKHRKGKRKRQGAKMQKKRRGTLRAGVRERGLFRIVFVVE